MSDKDSELLDRAFNADKFGNRIEAIRLYRLVASGNSEHSAYAENCAKNLEQLGVQETAKTQKTTSPDSVASSSGSANPFKSPNGSQIADEYEFDYASARRIQFSATVVRCLAIFCLIAAICSLLGTVRSYQFIHAASTFT